MTTKLTKCLHPDCGAEFFQVDTRQHPYLCIEHSQESERRSGWTPETSVD